MATASGNERCAIKMFVVERFEERKRRNSDKGFIVGMVSEGLAMPLPLGVRKSESRSAVSENASGSSSEAVAESSTSTQSSGKIMACYLETGTDLAKQVLSLEVRQRVLVTNMARSGPTGGSLRFTDKSKVDLNVFG